MPCRAAAWAGAAKPGGAAGGGGRMWATHPSIGVTISEASATAHRADRRTHRRRVPARSRGAARDTAADPAHRADGDRSADGYLHGWTGSRLAMSVDW